MNKVLWFAGILIGLMLAWYGYGLYVAQYQITSVKSSSDLVWYQVPEIGIEFQIRKSAADKLSYRYYYDTDNRIAGAYFSSVDLLQLPGCTFGGVMSVQRFSGTIENIPFTGLEDRVLYSQQFDDSVVVFHGPTSDCTRHERFTTDWTNLFRDNQPYEGWMLSLFESVKVSSFQEPKKIVLTDAFSEESDLVTYQVPELGIEFQVSKKIADELVYAVYGPDDASGSVGVSFSTKELALIPGCEASSGPLGSLSKIKGAPEDYEEHAYYQARNPRQFDQFFVIWSGPQAVCSLENRDEFDIFLGRFKRFDAYRAEHPEFNGLSVSVMNTLKAIAEK